MTSCPPHTPEPARSNPVVLDTRIVEAAPSASEADMMLFVLERSRAQFAWKAGGLDAAGLRFRLPSSALSLGRLLKHLALCEDVRTARDLRRQPLGEPWSSSGATRHDLWEWAWATADDDTPTELYGLWRHAVVQARAAWSDTLAHVGLDGPSGIITSDGTAYNLRRSLADMHDEYARHVGHADLLREAIDGLVGEDPPQA